MSKKCLKCGYVRQPTDTPPETACPSCGAIYAKVEAVMEQKADASFEQITPQYWNVNIHKDGRAERAILGQLFTTHGPYSVLGLRLDRLIKAEILRDASTISSTSKSDGVATTSVAGQIGRGVVGGVIAGPVGAIIGGSGASQKIETNTTTHQTRNVDIYLALFFKGAESIVVEVFDESAFKFLMASVGQKEWSQSQIDAAMQKAKTYDEWQRRKHAQDAKQDAQNRARSREWQGVLGKLLAGLLALFLLISYGTGKYEDYAVRKLLADGKFDEALKKVAKEGDKHKEVAEIILQNRKALLTASLGNGAGKTAGELRSFIDANFPDAILTSPTDIKIRIGDGWYRETLNKYQTR
jgi:hypothetical protein